MTVGVDLSIDPAEAFLANGSPDYVEEPDAEPHSRIGIVLAAALIMAFALMAKGLLEEETPPASPGEAQRRLLGLWERIAPMWLRASMPAMLHAFELGSTAQLGRGEIEFLAAQYAEALGQYANATSSEALLEGFQSQLNTGWDRDLAWRRAVQGYGLDKKGMRVYLTPLLTKPTSFTGVDVPDASKRLVSMLLSARAARMGDNESYHATQMAKHLLWVYQQAQGTLPADAMKRWATMEDERVCPICGPLDGVAVPLKATFQVGDVHLVCPGVHPNCRCTIELTYPEIKTSFAKADWDATEHPRAQRGRFADKVKRAPVRERVRVADPAAAAQAQQLAELLKTAAESADVGFSDPDVGFGAPDVGFGAPDVGFGEDVGFGDVGFSADTGFDTAFDVGFPEIKDTDFGAALRERSNTRRVVRIFWVPPQEPGEEAVQHEEAEEVEVPYDEDATYAEDAAWLQREQPAVMNAAKYYSAVSRYMNTSDGRRRFLGADDDHELLNPRVGTTIDFDAVGPGGTDADGKRWVSPTMEVGASQTEDDVDWIGDMIPWLEAKNSMYSALGQDARQYLAEMESERYDVADDDADFGPLEDAIDTHGVDATALVARRYGAVIPREFPEWEDAEKIAYMLDQYVEEKQSIPKGSSYTTRVQREKRPPTPWMVAMDAVKTQYAVLISSEEVVQTNLQDATADAIPPDLFVFDGYYGPTPSLVEGKYTVTAMETKRLSINQKTHLVEELNDRDVDLIFDEVRVIHLRPIEPAWVPQTPEQLRQGLPPIDYKG